MNLLNVCGVAIYGPIVYNVHKAFRSHDNVWKGFCLALLLTYVHAFIYEHWS